MIVHANRAVIFAPDLNVLTECFGKNTNSDLCACSHRCIQISCLWHTVCRCPGTVSHIFNIHTCTRFCTDITADDTQCCFCGKHNTGGQICLCRERKSFFPAVSDHTETIRICKSGFKFFFHGKRRLTGKIILHCQCQHTDTAERHCTKCQCMVDILKGISLYVAGIFHITADRKIIVIVFQAVIYFHIWNHNIYGRCDIIWDGNGFICP